MPDTLTTTDRETAAMLLGWLHEPDSVESAWKRARLIEWLEAEIGKLGELLSDPELYAREPVKFRKATEALAERQAKLAAAEEEWLTLEEKAASV